MPPNGAVALPGDEERGIPAASLPSLFCSIIYNFQVLLTEQ